MVSLLPMLMPLIVLQQISLLSLQTRKILQIQDITAANIGISQDWVNGTIHISTQGENSNDTVSNMLEAMTATYPYSKLTINNTPLFG